MNTFEQWRTWRPIRWLKDVFVVWLFFLYKYLTFNSTELITLAYEFLWIGVKYLERRPFNAPNKEILRATWDKKCLNDVSDISCFLYDLECSKSWIVEYVRPFTNNSCCLTNYSNSFHEVRVSTHSLSFCPGGCKKPFRRIEIVYLQNNGALRFQVPTSHFGELWKLERKKKEFYSNGKFNFSNFQYYSSIFDWG